MYVCFTRTTIVRGLPLYVTIFFFIQQSYVYGSCQFCGTNGTVAKDVVNFVCTIEPGSCSYNVTCIIFHYILPSTNEVIVVFFNLNFVKLYFLVCVCCAETGNMLTLSQTYSIVLKQSYVKIALQIRLYQIVLLKSYFRMIPIVYSFIMMLLKSTIQTCTLTFLYLFSDSIDLSIKYKVYILIIEILFYCQRSNSDNIILILMQNGRSC